MAPDLTAFVAARLGEDETRHHHAGEGRIAWLTYRLDNGELSHTTVAADHHDGCWCAGGKLLPEPASVLIVYDQAQALREVAAKRAIVTRWEIARNQVAVGAVNESAGYGPADPGWPLRTDSHELDVRSLAAVWSDHPDYQAGWAP